jgi:hypothetical protein
MELSDWMNLEYEYKSYTQEFYDHKASLMKEQSKGNELKIYDIKKL